MAPNLRDKEETVAQTQQRNSNLLKNIETELKLTDTEFDANKLRSLKNMIDRCHTTLLSLTQTDENYDVIENGLSDLDLYEFRINDVLNKRGVNCDNGNGLNVSSVSHQSDQNFRLNKLDIPKFAGKITKFREFWDLYDVAIHSNNALTDIQKFSHLKTLLTGSAYHCVGGFNLSAENYSAAILTLKERFDKSEILIDIHMNKLNNLRPIISDDPVPLRIFYNDMVTSIRALESLGVPTSEYERMIHRSLVNKLPNNMAESYLLNEGTRTHELEKFIKCVKSRVEI